MALSLFNQDPLFAQMAPFMQALSTTLPPPIDQGSINRRSVPMDVVEKEKNYDLVADLPGCTKADVKMYVDGDLIRICAEKDETRDDTGTTYHRMERTHQYVERAMRMPPNADTTKIEAHMENGVLTVTVPKKESQDLSLGRPVEIA